MFDEIDMRASYRSGYWQGAAIGVIGTIILGVLVGLFL